MTFSEWYAANIEPTLPTDVPEPIRTNARESMAACWNAALESVRAKNFRLEGIEMPLSPEFQNQIMELRAPTSTFEFERQRLRQ
jgi:hypothetical protein